MKYILMLTLVWTLPCLADVYLQSTLNDIDHRGHHQLVGSTTQHVAGNEFPGASPETPVFIRFTLDDNAKLSETLVDQNSNDPIISKPIYLALEYIRDTDFRINAPPESVAIVRWVAGETEIWIAVQSDTSTWLINEQEETKPPDADNEVAFTFGISAITSKSQNHFDQSNLLFNTNNPEPAGDEDAVSTLLCLDMRESTLPTTGPEKILRYFFEAYEADAEISPGVYAPGTPTGTEFVGEWSLARGMVRAVEVTPIDVDQPSRFSDEGSLVSLSVPLSLRLANAPGDEVLETLLVDGSTLTLSTRGNMGFSAVTTGEACLTPWRGPVHDEASAFVLEGETLYRELTMTWEYYDWHLSNSSLSATVEVVLPRGTIDPLSAIDWTLELKSHNGTRHIGGLDGPEQNIRCEATTAWREEGSVSLTDQEDVTAVLPHVTRAGGDFETTVHFANLTDETGGYLISGYDATGTFLGTMIGTIAPGTEETHAASALFGETLSHLRIERETSVTIAATYRATGIAGAPADIFPQSRMSKRHQVAVGPGTRTFDGVAITNTYSGETSLTILEIAPNGETVSVTNSFAPMAPWSKLLFVLEPTDPGNHFVIETSNPVAVQALRGTNDGRFLWSNPTREIDTGMDTTP